MSEHRYVCKCMENTKDRPMEVEATKLQSIAKITFLFGSTQAFNILIRIMQNKVVAVFLGVAGVGLVGLYNTMVHLLQIGCSLGVNQSAIRTIAAASANINDDDSLRKSIFAFQRLSMILALSGGLLTCLISPLLSWCAFGNFRHTFSCALLGIVVGINILSDNQIAVLKGTRRLRNLAKIYCFGSLTGLIVSFPLFYLWGMHVIIPSLILIAIGLFVFSYWAVREYNWKFDFLPGEFKTIVRPIITAGVMLMLSGFILNFSGFAIITFIRSYGNLKEVGFYAAGITVMYGYFGMIMNSMTNYYYPRISQISDDSSKIILETNRQILVQVILIFPCIITLIVFMPLVIRILYSVAFLQSMNFIRIALFGVFLGVCASPLDLIFVAQNKNISYLVLCLISRLILICLCMIGYHYFRLTGMGVAMFIHGLIHYIGVQIFLFYQQKIHCSLDVWLYVIGVLTCMATAYGITWISDPIQQVMLGAFYVIVCWLIALHIASKKLNVNIKQFFFRRGKN